MHLLLANTQLVVMALGFVSPLVGYILNHVGPWVDEKVKGVVQVLVAAVVAGLYTALNTSVFGWNDTTLQLVGSAVFAALMAHHWLWKPSGISTALGAGSNKA